MLDRVSSNGRRVDFEGVYRQELVPIVALAIALTGNRDTGIDLAQEAMLRAYRDWSRVEQLDRPGAWIRRVVINLAHEARRRGSREQRALRRVDDSKLAELAPRNDEFWSAVRDLPGRQRTAVALRYVEDLTVVAIATVMEVSEGTVKTLLFRARRTLAHTMGLERGNDDDDR